MSIFKLENIQSDVSVFWYDLDNWQMVLPEGGHVNH